MFAIWIVVRGFEVCYYEYCILASPFAENECAFTS
jgi:hypothetical protein